jgi:hypothetical protein
VKQITTTLLLGSVAVEISRPENLPLLLPASSTAFQASKAHADIRWTYQVVDPGSSIQADLDPEKDFPGARINRLGDGSLLMRSPQFQARLDRTRDHLPWLAIEMHEGAVTILDFKQNRSDMFFIPEFADELAWRGTGPAMLAPFLPNFDACLLHASAIARQGRAAVFLASDEGGKTTAVRLSSSGTVLGDDQVVLRRSGSGFRVSGTPWGLQADAKTQAPLGGLFLLSKADGFALEPLPVRDLASQIWEESKDPLSILPKPLKQKVFAIICDIATAVPAWRMSFAKDHIDWQAIDKAMNKKE